jgi:hypothetical protein
MSVGETHHAEHTGPSGTDVLIALLSAIVVAGVVWSVVFGALAGIAYALEFFQVALPEVAVTGLRIATQFLPILAAIPAAWVGYKFILRLP